MRKLTILIVALVTLFAFAPSSIASTKVMWDGMELKKGQIGRVTFLEKGTLFKVRFHKDGGVTLFEPVRELPKGGVYRVYGTKEVLGWAPLYDVGAGYYVIQSVEPNVGHLKYETPSKAKLALANK